MKNKQTRLITAVKVAMATQGVSWADLARAAGTSSSMISLALSGKCGMGEEKWRMCCEKLGLNYDEITADPEPEIPGEAAARGGRYAHPYGNCCRFCNGSAGRGVRRGDQSRRVLPSQETARGRVPWDKHAPGRAV